MNKRNILTRFQTYYQKHGLAGTLRRICEYPHRVLKGQEILFFAEMNELSDAVLNLPDNITIEFRRSYDDAVQPDTQKMVHYWNEQHLIDRIKERFEKGAVLWIIKLKGRISGFVWSIRGKMVSPYYLPLTPHDAVLFDSVIFNEFRGRGLYPLLMNYVFWQLKVEGVHRTFGHSYAWNTVSIHGIEKTYFRRLGQVRRFNIFGKNVVIFSEVQKDI
jgi:RimJ/RimL family protein N-acetyltransferase